MFNVISKNILQEMFTENKKVLLVIAVESDITEEIVLDKKNVNLYDEHLIHFDGNVSKSIMYVDIVQAFLENTQNV